LKGPEWIEDVKGSMRYCAVTLNGLRFHELTRLEQSTQEFSKFVHIGTTSARPLVLVLSGLAPKCLTRGQRCFHGERWEL